MFMIAMLFRRSCPIVVRRYVSMRRKALNDHSTEQEPAGIDTRMVATSYGTGSNARHGNPSRHDEACTGQLFSHMIDDGGIYLQG